MFQCPWLSCEKLRIRSWTFSGPQSMSMLTQSSHLFHSFLSLAQSVFTFKTVRLDQFVSSTLKESYAVKLYKLIAFDFTFWWFSNNGRNLFFNGAWAGGGEPRIFFGFHLFSIHKQCPRPLGYCSPLWWEKCLKYFYLTKACHGSIHWDIY